MKPTNKLKFFLISQIGLNASTLHVERRSLYGFAIRMSSRAA